ncbi:hypothetical protein IQ06DRAFT_13330 [Phaeosphaeriaceae sp. SRC1lsM3a]|nr:hypothetical protein IQ06DRAFT_13330 [Stagonospora sp. SRC1lsM3a]
MARTWRLRLSCHKYCRVSSLRLHDGRNFGHYISSTSWCIVLALGCLDEEAKCISGELSNSSYKGPIRSCSEVGYAATGGVVNAKDLNWLSLTAGLACPVGITRGGERRRFA